MDSVCDEGVRLQARRELDRANAGVLNGSAFVSLERLITFLASIMHSSGQWRSIVDEVCLKHPLAVTLLADPITRRSFEKPRGYPGDAGLLDLIYGAGESVCPERPLSGVGKAIYQYTYSSFCGRAVRFRRHLLAERIDLTSARVSGAKVASIAAGHFREAEWSMAVRSGRLGRLVAFDQDGESLSTIKSSCGSSVECYRGSIRDLLVGKTDLGDFDFIYSAGLLDYLSDSAATALVKAMFGMLRPGGQLLIANFRKHIRDAAYLDSFMRWNLTYRDQHEMKCLVEQIPSQEMVNPTVFTDHLDYVVYATAERAH